MTQSLYAKVTFLPGGGAEARGCFVEEGSPVRYETPGPLRLIVNCAALAYRRSWGLGIVDPADRATWKDEVAERFLGDGDIEPDPEGQVSFSFLGSARQHSRLRVAIRRGERKAIYLVASRNADEDATTDDQDVALDVVLDAKSFDEFRQELRANPAWRVDIAVRLDGLSGIYSARATQEAGSRVLKLLESPDAVSNRDDMPEAFGTLVLGEPFPFSVTVGPPDDGRDPALHA